MLTSTQRLKQGLKNLRRPQQPNKRGGVYDSEMINECGDQTQNTKANRRPTAMKQILLQNPILTSGLCEHPPGFAHIVSFCKWAQANHVRVLATYPNLCRQPEYYLPPGEQAARKIRDFYGEL